MGTGVGGREAESIEGGAGRREAKSIRGNAGRWEAGSVAALVTTTAEERVTTTLR
jgi:hypothetical protein